MDLSACLSGIAHLWIFVCLQSPLRTRWLMDPRSSCWWLGLRTTWPVWPAGPSLRPTSSGPRTESLWRGPTSPRWLTHIHETQHIYKSCRKKKRDPHSGNLKSRLHALKESAPQIAICFSVTATMSLFVVCLYAFCRGHCAGEIQYVHLRPHITPGVLHQGNTVCSTRSVVDTVSTRLPQFLVNKMITSWQMGTIFTK